jgi:hypothetical protein
MMAGCPRDPEEDGFMPRAKYRSDRRVDDYIKALPGWQQKVCWQVRDLVHAADAEVSETIKRTKLPYFTLDGNICALLRKLSSGVPTWRFIAKGRCSIAGYPCSRRIVRKTQVRLLCPLLKDRSERRTPLQSRRDARKESRRPTWRREAAARSRLRTICQMQLLS